jgi:hypothetical protein
LCYLGQNCAVKSYEEVIETGAFMFDEAQFELYKWLKINHAPIYIDLEKELISKKVATKIIANGENKFVISFGKVRNLVRELGDPEFSEGMRQIWLTPFSKINRKRLNNFFAQCEVDVLHNYPYVKEEDFPYFNYGINTYPYYSLNYFSNGRGKIKGFVAKHTKGKRVWD